MIQFVYEYIVFGIYTMYSILQYYYIGLLTIRQAGDMDERT